MGAAVNIRKTTIFGGISFDVLHGIARRSWVVRSTVDFCDSYLSEYGKSPSVAVEWWGDYKSNESPMNRSLEILNDDVQIM